MNNKTFKVIGIVIIILIALFIAIKFFGGSSEDTLICTKTTQNEKYTQNEEFEYVFGEQSTRINMKISMTFTNGINEEEYNKLAKTIEEDDDGITSYGWDTKIYKKGNTVTITSYTPNISGQTKNEVKAEMEAKGYKCK